MICRRSLSSHWLSWEESLIANSVVAATPQARGHASPVARLFRETEEILLDLRGNLELTQFFQDVRSRLAELFPCIIGQTVNMKFNQGSASSISSARMRLEVQSWKQTSHANKHCSKRRLDNSVNHQSSLNRRSATAFLQ